MNARSLLIAVAVLAAGCAASNPVASNEAAAGVEYQTGSSIPRKQTAFRREAKVVNPTDLQKFEDEMALRSATRQGNP